MDAEEKLKALKKAYADIIFNTTKDAAARVMSSERKAARYQHELKVSKEEALQMLLCLKQMMDFKVSEAEAASRNQQSKIDELEAQLQEAEDIVNDLREELGEAHAELERVKRDNSQCVRDLNNACSREAETGIHSYQSDKFLHLNSQDGVATASDATMQNLSQRNECPKCFSNTSCTCSSYIRNRDPPVISRGKEHGLYRNGCTQRIHACERNLLDKELSNNREQKEGKDKALASENKSLSELEKKLLADIELSNCRSFVQKKKRATRLRKGVTHLGGKRTNLFPKPDQLPKLSSRNVPVSIKDAPHSSESPFKTAPMLSQAKAENNVEETGFSKCSPSPDINMDVEKVDMQSNSLELNSSCTTEGLPSQPVRERVIKYTFQRKRKREASRGAEANTSVKTEKETGEKQTVKRNLEKSKSSLSTESSREQRRLAQVARQLISLSEKKWWH